MELIVISQQYFLKIVLIKYWFTIDRPFLRLISKIKIRQSVQDYFLFNLFS